MKLILTRHGQTLLNTQGITMGQLDSALTQAGEQQARRAGEMLSKTKVTAIYSSDLGRCRKTSEEIQKYLPGNPPLILVEDLREINFGIYQGKPCGDVPVIEGGYTTQPFPGGESNEVLATRVITAVNKIYKDHKDETVLIVTHSGPIAVIVAAQSGAPLADMGEHKVDNGQIIELKVSQPLTQPK